MSSTVSAANEADNRMVWDHRPGHYEVWYCTLSHRATRHGFWIRYTLEAPLPGHGQPYAQLWFARFDPDQPANTFGINRRFPITALDAEPSPFRLRIGAAELRNDGMHGALSGGGHEVSWRFDWPPAAASLRMLPDFAYKSPIASTKVYSPNQDVALSGEILVDGRRYELDGDGGGQTHLWGRKHAYSWGWAHCNTFDDGAASFEGLVIRLKRGALILPTMTLFTLRLDDEEIAFREAWKIPLARGEFRTGHVQLFGVSPNTKVEATFTCRPEDMLLAEYLDPDGDPAFCHNTCCGDATIHVYRRSPFVGKWRKDRVLNARHTAHFEWAGRAGDVLQVKRAHTAIP